MRTSEIDPNASGEIEMTPRGRHDILVEKKTVVVNKRMLLPTRKLRAQTIKYAAATCATSRRADPRA
jgi:hypothetical protein